MIDDNKYFKSFNEPWASNFQNYIITSTKYLSISMQYDFPPFESKIFNQK